jgi:heat shock protein HtpX
MYKAIAANKRNTVFIMAIFVALIGAIGWAVSAYYGNTSFAYFVIGGAFLYAVLQYFIASKLALAVTGAKEIQKRDNPRLFRIVENLAITLGMNTPKIYLIDDKAPNAFATGRDPKHAVVAATTGLLEVMDDRELEAVMAHEMGHVQNYDIRVNMIAFGLVSAIALLSDVVLRILFYGNSDRRDIHPIILVVGLVVVILAPIVATMVQLAISRQREYLADASGAMTTRDADGLASALEKLQKYGQPMRRQTTSTAHLFFNNPLKAGMLSKLFSTHPPLEERIKRLRTHGSSF